MRLIMILLLICHTSLAQTNKIIYHSLEVAYIGLNALDLITTYKVLDYGGYEANPVMAKFIHNKPLTIGFKTLNTGLFLMSCRLIKRDHPKLSFALLLVGNLAYVFIVNHNYQLSVRLKI